MTQQAQQAQGKTTHFDAAKIIVETLQGLDKTSQALAMRFAAETLGLQSASVTQSHLTPVTPTSTPLSPPSSGGAPHLMDIKQFTAAKAPKVISSLRRSSRTFTASKHQRPNEGTQ